MIKIIIDKDKVDISTEDKTTTGCSEQERKLLYSVAKALCEECREGAE